LPGARLAPLACQIDLTAADAGAVSQRGHLAGDPLGDVCRGGELGSGRPLGAGRGADQRRNQCGRTQQWTDR
jgi:hypothetical protein